MTARMRVAACLPAALLAILAGCAPLGPATGTNADTGTTRIAIIGSNDVHGQLLPGVERGGLVTLSGYVEALRESGDVDAVLLIDGGDMWQGTLDSNIDEGASVVAAYNAMGYAAATIGNHEFDFGPEGAASIPLHAGDDPRGALKARAGAAAFPLLAANLAETAGTQPPPWPNVRASVMVEAAGRKVGIVGVMTERALSATIGSNVHGLVVTPLAEAIRREAGELRDAGAELVIVTAHAGGRCASTGDALNLSSCQQDGEIFRLARDLPPGLVDHIVAGHVHGNLAHIVNGISISSNDSMTRYFGRVDFVLGDDGGVTRARLFAPQAPCPYNEHSGACAWQDPGDGSVVPAQYAGREVVPDATVVAIAERAHRVAEAQKNASLGVVLGEAFTLEGNPESSLGNLVTTALLESGDADVAIHNVSGGLRVSLPAGELLYGAVYEMFPFDNRVVMLDLTGRELRRVLEAQALKGDRRAGIAGVHVAATCHDGSADLVMARPDGSPVLDTDSVRLMVNDFLALGGDGILSPILPDGGFAVDDRQPGVRDVLVAWLGTHDRLDPADWDSSAAPRWQLGPGCASGAGH